MENIVHIFKEETGNIYGNAKVMLKFWKTHMVVLNIEPILYLYITGGGGGVIGEKNCPPPP